jgi:hypothetical protein
MKTLNQLCKVGLIGLVLVLAPNAIANVGEGTNHAPFQSVETKHLDEAWAHPDFEPKNYQEVAIAWEQFDFRPGAERYVHRGRIRNYELTDEAKALIEDQAKAVFKQQFELLQNVKLVDIEDVDAQTLIVNLRIEDFVNNVPDRHQRQGLDLLLLRRFGEATLNIEFEDGGNDGILFQGHIRQNIEPLGIDFQRGDMINARRLTKLKLQRWAKGLRKNIDDMF